VVLVSHGLGWAPSATTGLAATGPAATGPATSGPATSGPAASRVSVNGQGANGAASRVITLDHGRLVTGGAGSGPDDPGDGNRTLAATP
jgi:hypothetical protein